MKIIGILCAFYFLTVSAWITNEQIMDLQKYGVECIQELGLSIDTIQEALFGDASKEKETIQCLAACVLKKVGIMSENGTLSEDAIREKVFDDVSQDHVDKLIAKCIKISGDTDCEKAAKFVKCTVKNVIAEDLS